VTSRAPILCIHAVNVNYTQRETKSYHAGRLYIILRLKEGSGAQMSIKLKFVGLALTSALFSLFYVSANIFVIIAAALSWASECVVNVN
jgi:hypothetical protein